MKIGIDGRAAKWYRGTGIGNYTYQIINSINNLDNSDDFLMFMPENCDTDIKFNKNFSVRNISERPSTNFWNEINIPNILQDNEVEIYHVPQNGIGLPLEKTCKMIITLHDIIPYKMPETVGPNYLKIFTEQLPYLIPKCDGIITVSNYSKDDIVKYFNFPKEKIYVTHLAPEKIYNPRNKIESKKILEKYYGILGDYILYVGGFSPRKNIIGLIEAFSKLNAIYDNRLKLVIAGRKGISYDIYKKKAEELNLDNLVIFPGFIPIEHMPYLYCGSELFVYPSFYEGFGLPPVEAMACKVPVIASNTTSLPEILMDSALLIDPYNPYELYQAMLKVLEDSKLRHNLISKGFLRASQLSWNETSAKTLEAYKQVVNN
ncbi:glycosyltransferase family 4 protein [Clostridium sp. 19966]|uniref:glycosyltransferase family 4 protein n=1 Tax=Clostridium sp. 19966 TaxID=2768166 RepID=UPI0028DF9CE8|nr:glycosyltransferase family 1 protein [Clostridium sp. 19966]MDT8715631.1 glycosyltransferase family 4 protein [Clostridium sp. 19966]